MQMQSVYNRKMIIIWFGFLCILYCLTRLVNCIHWATLNRIENPPLCIAEVLPISLSKCLRMNQNKTSPKEPEQTFGRWPTDVVEACIRKIHMEIAGNLILICWFAHEYQTKRHQNSLIQKEYWNLGIKREISTNFLLNLNKIDG